MGEVEFDLLLRSIYGGEKILTPAWSDHAGGELILAGSGCFDGVFEGLMSSTGPAVVELLAAKDAVHEDDLASALGGLGGGGSGNGNDALRIDRNVPVLFGDRDLGDLHFLLGFGGFGNVLADGVKSFGPGILNDTFLKVEGGSIPELRFGARLQSINAGLSGDIADPLRALDHHERLAGSAGLGGGEKIEIFIVSPLGPAASPSCAKAGDPTVRSPVDKGGVTALRAGGGGDSEGAESETADKGASPADAAIHENILKKLKLGFVILIVL